MREQKGGRKRKRSIHGDNSLCLIGKWSRYERRERERERERMSKALEF